MKPAAEAESDERADIQTRKEIKLYNCSDEEGTLKITEVKTGPLLQSDLESKDSFIIDNGNCGIWVWVGKKASQAERTEAMRNAQGFIKKKSEQYYLYCAYRAVVAVIVVVVVVVVVVVAAAVIVVAAAAVVVVAAAAVAAAAVAIVDNNYY